MLNLNVTDFYFYYYVCLVLGLMKITVFTNNNKTISKRKIQKKNILEFSLHFLLFFLFIYLFFLLPWLRKNIFSFAVVAIQINNFSFFFSFSFCFPKTKNISTGLEKTWQYIYVFFTVVSHFQRQMKMNEYKIK